MLNYADLLKRPEWSSKRLEILRRDNNKCSMCHNSKLLADFRISYVASGTYSSGKVVFIVYDKEKLRTERCVTDLLKPYVDELFRTYDQRGLICLSNGSGAFCRLIGMVFTEELINVYPRNAEIKDMLSIAQDHQKKQEKYLKELDEVHFNKLNWENVRTLHIHHKYYLLDKMPWEYDNEALQTLCWHCHEELHKEIKIPCYNEKFNLMVLYTPCQRCYGAGVFPEFNHVQHGICFRCNGARFEELINK